MVGFSAVAGLLVASAVIAAVALAEESRGAMAPAGDDWPRNRS